MHDLPKNHFKKVWNLHTKMHNNKIFTDVPHSPAGIPPPQSNPYIDPTPRIPLLIVGH